METRKSKESDRLKLLQEFSGRVRKLSEGIRETGDFRKLREFKTDFGKNDDLIGIDIDKDVAEPGEYQLEIVQLAGRHSMISNGFDSPDDEVGVGYFEYETASGESASVYIDSSNNTLKGLANAINSEKDLNLQAMVVNDGSGSSSPWHLIIASKKTGMENDIIYPDFYFVDGDTRFVLDDERVAQSAVVKLNGFEIMTPVNKIKDLIPGVNLQLKQAREGYEFDISIGYDLPKISGKIKTLVETINSVLEFINKQNQLDEKSDTSRTLGGDGMLRTIESQLRSLVQRPIALDEDGESVLRLQDLGVVFEKTGLLAFNSEKFQKKLADDYDSVATFISGPNGFSSQLRTIVDNLVGLNGTLNSREKTFRDGMRRVDDQIAAKEQQIAKKEERLKRQFGNLEATIQRMQGQQQFMMQAMGAAAQG